ncbi:MAG TPA: DUF2231 domain-containing protein [Planctomycetota bacterium]
MIELLAAADTAPLWPWVLFGRFHPLVVHFPIALLTIAALVEGWGLARRRTAAGDTSWICVGIGALSAIVATVMGYAFAEGKTSDPDTLQLHERLGLITTIVSVLTVALAWRARRSGGTGGPAMAFRAFLFVSALGVGVTGHFGGEMVYPDWWKYRMPWNKEAEAKPLQNPDPTPAMAGNVDFVKEIAPIIKASCLKCHGPEKTKGKLRLDSKAGALKKGIKPGKPDDSTFYTLLISDDPDERMPEKADPLPKAQIELIKKWIVQGAPWPDGFEIK